MENIYVTKSFLPPVKNYQEYIDKIWQSNRLTNQGPLLKEFEGQASNYLGVKNFHFVSNGTVALQVALNGLNINSGEIITTPFSYAATVSAILWERCKPVFVDIDPETLCIDPNKIESAITKNTKAILPVHVFGFPCDIDKIERIAKDYNLPVIYDGAHSFGAKYRGRALLDYGTVATCSFHATKPFHTIEGGCVISNQDKVSDKIELIKRFGHHGDDHQMLGINAKASEFQAAMGLCNLKYLNEIIKSRKKVNDLYNRLIGGKLQIPKPRKDTIQNYAYFPVIFDSEKRMHKVNEKLQSSNIFPRRYFFPSLNKLPYIKTYQSCPNSEDIASRILCLPLYGDIQEAIVEKISAVAIA